MQIKKSAFIDSAKTERLQQGSFNLQQSRSASPNAEMGGLLLSSIIPVQLHLHQVRSHYAVNGSSPLQNHS